MKFFKEIIFYAMSPCMIFFLLLMNFENYLRTEKNIKILSNFRYAEAMATGDNDSEEVCYFLLLLIFIMSFYSEVLLSIFY